MNLWILIGFVCLIGFLMFGKNPVREFQNNQRALMEKYGKDDLTANTNLYLEKQQQQNSGGVNLGFGGATPVEKPVDQSGSDMKAAMRSSAVAVGNDPSLREKGIYVAPANRDIEGNTPSDLIIQQGGRVVGGAAASNANSNNNANDPGRSNSYYPPIVGETTIQYPGDTKLTGKEPKLRSGQPIAFDGNMIYALDPQGNRTLLPDGEYTLQNGSNFVVIGGSRQYRN